MYNLPYHKEKDEAGVKAFIARYPFAFLTGCDKENKPVVTQIPLFLEENDGKQFLRGHIMRNTDHHKAFEQNNNVLAVFTGHHIYVSATWYSNPYQGSTWNYMSVHVKGKIKMLDELALENVLRKTSLHFENNNHQAETAFDNLPMEYKQRVMKAVVAFEIEIDKIDNVFKLSQDRDVKSYENIIERLKDFGESGNVISEEMRKRKKDVFPEIKE